MKKLLLILPLVFLILLLPNLIFSQTNANHGALKKFQLSLDGGPLDYPMYSGAISFAFRRSERWYWGLRLGFVWEDNLNTYEGIEIWDEIHADIFRRLYSSNYLYIDFGGSVFAHAP